MLYMKCNLHVTEAGLIEQSLSQEKLELKDFNIKKEAKGVDKAVIRKFKTVVKNKTLTIRFHWAGKGTTGAPRRGTYGPLISAISVDSGKNCNLNSHSFL